MDINLKLDANFGRNRTQTIAEGKYRPGFASTVALVSQYFELFLHIYDHILKSPS